MNGTTVVSDEPEYSWLEFDGEKCNRCGTCGYICPTRNITVTEDAVMWGSSCTQCYACIHWCPQEAIEMGGRTYGKRRYHHPDVSIKDMREQRGE